MEMARRRKVTKTPEIVKTFDNLLWVNLPSHWIVKTVYFRQTLFVSAFVEHEDEEVYNKIRRSFTLKVLRDREEDLQGLARDCADEMKSEAIR